MDLRRAALIGVPMVAVVAVAGLLWTVRGILPPFVFALVLAHFASPAVEALQARGFRRDYSIAMLYVGISLLTLAAGYVAVSAIVEAADLASQCQCPSQIQDLLPRIREKSVGGIPLGRYAADQLARDQEKLVAFATSLVPSVAVSVLEVLGLMFVIPFIAFFIMLYSPALRRAGLRALPSRYVERVLHLLGALDETVGNYLRGILVESACVAAMTLAGLWLVGLNYSVWLALLSGVSNLIPYMGPVVGGVPALAIALFQFDTMGPVLQAAAVFATVQFVDNWFVQPLILRKAVDIHPVTVLFALAAGGQLAGVVGLFLAVPAACILRLLFAAGAEWYRSEFRERRAASPAVSA